MQIPPISGRATMRDVAALAGVSLKTVSRVVNLEAGVSENLVRRVTSASETLGYRHNLAASNLRRGQRTRSVALLVQDLSNDYSAAVLRAIDDTARAHRIVVMSASLDEEVERERELVANFISRRVDGLILMPATTDQSYLRTDVAAGFSVVMIDRRPQGLRADFVVVDNAGGAQAATTHLLRHGHRRVALVTDDLTIATAAARHDGYVAALRAAGIGPDATLMRTARTEAASAAAVDELLALPEPPTAVFAARNVATVGCFAGLRRLGLQHRVALIGFDDLALADLVEPGISTIGQDPARTGITAAQLLFDRLAGSHAPPSEIVLPTALHPRGSGEIRPGG